jgi:nitroimidazol reductase NimA-like FMN-containing flavoprotein (pyridoxamine 5'-phosphate oxidase superfamily)
MARSDATDDTRYTGVWDAAEVAAFCDDHPIPLRLGCRTPRGGLWMLSLWYSHDDGRFRCATKADADVVGFLRADPTVAFEVSTNEPPYRGVRGAGTASVAPDEEKDLLRSLLERYLGGTDSTLARRLLDPDRDEVTVTVTPDRIHSWDFGGRMPSGRDGR